MTTNKKTTKSNGAHDALKPVEAAVAAGKETVEKAVKAGTEAAALNYERAVAISQEQVETASKAAFKGYGDIANLNRDTMDAVVKTSTILAQGYEAISKEIMAFTQASIEANVSATRAVFGAKSINEMIDLQNNFTRSSFDKAVAEGVKLGEMTAKTHKEAALPIQARVETAVETLMKSPVA